MDEEADIPQFNLDAQFEKFAWEARARITWGDKPEDVRTWLIKSGVDEHTSQQIVAICMRERGWSLRKKGLRDLLLAILLIGAAAAVAFVALPAADQLIGVPVKAHLYVWAACFFAGMFGLHFAWRGTSRLVLGARTLGADSDVGGIW
jgi:hypothetical protein